MKRRISLLVIMLFSLFPSIVLAETVSTAEIDALFADRNYAEAASRLQDALTQNPDNADYLAYLLGNALFYQKEYAQAIERFQRFAADYPQSKWLPKALFRQADCYLALKQFQQAGEIYLPQVTQLVSAERKERVVAPDQVRERVEPEVEVRPEEVRVVVRAHLQGPCAARGGRRRRSGHGLRENRRCCRKRRCHGGSCGRGCVGRPVIVDSRLRVFLQDRPQRLQLDPNGYEPGRSTVIRHRLCR